MTSPSAGYSRIAASHTVDLAHPRIAQHSTDFRDDEVRQHEDVRVFNAQQQQFPRQPGRSRRSAGKQVGIKDNAHQQSRGRTYCMASSTAAAASSGGMPCAAAY